MSKLIVVFVVLIIGGCSTVPVFDELDSDLEVERTSDESNQDFSVEIIKESGLVEQPSSVPLFESEELELALRSMLSRLVRSSSELEGEGKGWDEGVYLVKAGDTLSGIVHDAVKGTDIHPDFILNAIVRKNPSVFVRGNPNWMLSGKKIKFPQAEDFHRMIFKEAPENGGQSVDSDPYEGWITYP